MFLSLNYIQSDLHGWVWPWKTKPSLINDESLVSFNTFIELFRSRAQITKEKKYRIGSPTFKILTNTKCFPEIHHFHLKNLGITISQTLMATNSPLFSMMFTVTWDTRCQLIGWLVRVEVEQHSTENIYLPSRCWGIANATRVLQPLVHHSFSLLGVLLEPIVIPVLLAGRPLRNNIWWEIWWKVSAFVVSPAVIFQTLSLRQEQCPVGWSPISDWSVSGGIYINTKVSRQLHVSFVSMPSMAQLWRSNLFRIW